MVTLKFLSATSVRRLQAHSFLFCGQTTNYSQLAWRPLSLHYSVHSVPEDTASSLSTKKCVPCNSDLRPMEEENALLLMEKVPGWNIIKDKGPLKLTRSWKVKNFVKGIEFFESISKVAETEGHHPDLHLEKWNNVRVEIWTHAIGGLTENDFILAAKINGLNLQEFLRKHVAAAERAGQVIDR